MNHLRSLLVLLSVSMHYTMLQLLSALRNEFNPHCLIFCKLLLSCSVIPHGSSASLLMWNCMSGSWKNVLTSPENYHTWQWSSWSKGVDIIRRRFGSHWWSMGHTLPFAFWIIAAWSQKWFLPEVLEGEPLVNITFWDSSFCLLHYK